MKERMVQISKHDLAPMTDTGILNVSVIFMNTRTLIETLYPIYFSLREGDLQKAEILFSELHIVDTKEHLALPEPLRHLIWNLYEYLVMKNTNYTDKKEIMEEFEKVFKYN